MPPPWATNPAPKTESAREARKAFYCELCQKGYSRINEYEAHEGSYDHQHKKRLKEMKAMSRDPNATAKARKAEQRAEEGGVMTIKPISLGSSTSGVGKGGGSSSSSSTGFKKGGFKNAFGGGEEIKEVEVKKEVPGVGMTMDVVRGEEGGDGQEVKGRAEPVDEDEEGDWGDYDPKRPTGCWSECPSLKVVAA